MPISHAENFTSQPLTESQGDLPNRPATAFSIAVPALSVTFMLHIIIIKMLCCEYDHFACLVADVASFVE
jgi:hypothetical protein